MRNNHRVKIVCGGRRCGKSFLLNHLFRNELLRRDVTEDHFLYISLDGIDQADLHNPLRLHEYVRNLIVDDKPYYLVLDEVQNVFAIVNPALTGGKIVKAKKDDEDVLSYVSVVLSLMKMENLDIYITGSNSRFLSKDIVTDFRDRGDQIMVLPLSFAEFTSCSGQKDLSLVYEEYALHGGMPLCLGYEEASEKEKYLRNLYSLTYKKDVIERNHLENERALDVISRVLSSSIGSLVNSQKVADTFKSREKSSISSDSIDKYLKCLEEAYLVNKVNRYDLRGRRQIGALYKYYFTDLGIRNSLLDFLSADHGHVMENIIYNELIYRGYTVEIGIMDTYTKEAGLTKRDTLETDFLVRNGSNLCYIQACYDLYGEENYQREIRPLTMIRDSFKKIVVTKSSTPIRHDQHGITTMNIIDFLKDENSLEK